MFRAGTPKLPEPPVTADEPAEVEVFAEAAEEIVSDEPQTPEPLGDAAEPDDLDQ